MSESQIAVEWSFKDSIYMYMAEFIGTLMLVLTIGTIRNEAPQQMLQATLPLGTGFILVSMVYAFGHISGAHFNPAVTLSVYVRGFISPYDAIIFVFIQVLGGICGAFLTYGVTNSYPEIHWDHSRHLGNAFLAEYIYTAALCIVVINVATTESQRGNFFYGVAIGLTVAVGSVAVVNISGAALNPAVGTALTLTGLLKHGAHHSIEKLWLYWVAPLLGGLTGGLSFYVINYKEYQNSSIQEQSTY
jgi:aquaporin Z